MNHNPLPREYHGAGCSGKAAMFLLLSWFLFLFFLFFKKK